MYVITFVTLLLLIIYSDKMVVLPSLLVYTKPNGSLTRNPCAVCVCVCVRVCVVTFLFSKSLLLTNYVVIFAR